MNSRRYEFLKKDIKFLRKNAFCKLFYSVIFISIFVMQFMLFIYENKYSSINLSEGLIGASVMIGLIILTMIGILLAGKDLNTIVQIKKNNHSVRQVYIFKNTDKAGFLNLYAITNRMIGIISLILSASVITYAILNYIYNSIVLFYLPIILSITVSSFSSSGYISSQLKISRNVNEYYDSL